jgi:hypothetical protein
MTYFFRENQTNIVNSLFITDSCRMCQKLHDLKAIQVTFKDGWYFEEISKSDITDPKVERF